MLEEKNVSPRWPAWTISSDVMNKLSEASCELYFNDVKAYEGFDYSAGPLPRLVALGGRTFKPVTGAPTLTTCRVASNMTSRNFSFITGTENTECGMNRSDWQSIRGEIITWVFETEAGSTPPFFTMDATSASNLSSNGVSLEIGGSSVKVGTVIREGDEIIAYCSSKREWRKVGDELPLYFITEGLEGVNKLHFTLSTEDSKIASLKIPLNTSPATSIYTETFTNTRFWRVTSQDLITLSKNSATLYFDGVKADEYSECSYNSIVTINLSSDRKFTISYGELLTSLVTIFNSNQQYVEFDLISEFPQIAKMRGVTPAYGAVKTLNLYTENYVPPPPFYTFSRDDVELFTFNKMIVTISGKAVAEGTKLNYSETLTASIPDDREFYLIPYGASSILSLYFWVDAPDGSSSRIPFILNPDNDKVATFSLENRKLVGASIFADTKQILDIPSGNNVYLIDSVKLAAINSQRLVIHSDELVFDYGQYILGVISIPTSIPSYALGDDELVRLANLNTTVVAPSIKSDLIKFDLGSIVVPDAVDFTDINNVTCILHLPNSSAIEMDSNDVIGSVIKIGYYLDAYSGNATINVFSSKTDSLIYTGVCTFGINIPYTSYGNDTRNVDNPNIDVSGINDVLTPFLEVRTYETYLKDGVYSVPVYVEGVLLGKAGYFIVENIDIVGNIRGSEKDELIGLLQSGVYIL